MKCGQKKLENKEFSGKTDCRRHPNAPQSMKNQVKSTDRVYHFAFCLLLPSFATVYSYSIYPFIYLLSQSF